MLNTVFLCKWVIYASDFCFRLKEIIFKERNSKVQLEVMVHRLQNEIKKLTIELIKARDQQEDHIRHLRSLERALEKMERQKGQQQMAQVFRPVGQPGSGGSSSGCRVDWRRVSSGVAEWRPCTHRPSGDLADVLQVARLVFPEPGRKGSLGPLKGVF